MKYVISRHARDRFVKRFRLKFHSSYFLSEHKYGPTSVVKSINKNITFICTPLNEGVTIVRTAVNEFDPRY